MTCNPHAFEVFSELHQCVHCGMRLEDHQRMEDYRKELSTVITTWSRELDIEKTWDDELHAADVLDKYVFPKIRDWKEHFGNLVIAHADAVSRFVKAEKGLWPNEPCGRSLEQCPYNKQDHIAYFKAQK